MLSGNENEIHNKSSSTTNSCLCLGDLFCVCVLHKQPLQESVIPQKPALKDNLPSSRHCILWVPDAGLFSEKPQVRTLRSVEFPAEDFLACFALFSSYHF